MIFGPVNRAFNISNGLHGLLLIILVLNTSCKATRFKIEKTPLSKFFETSPVFRESHTGLLVYDPVSKSSIFDYNSQKHFTPASNTKLITCLAATRLLGDSIPALDYCIADDTLFFTGTGDPTFLYEGFEYGKTFNFLMPKPYALAYIPKPVDDGRFGPGWAWDDYSYYFSTEKASFPIYGNMATFRKDTMMDHIAVTPFYFQDNLSVIRKPDTKGFTLQREEFSNQFTLFHDGSTPAIYAESPFLSSDELFVRLLSDTLKRPVVLRNSFPDCSIKTIFSAPSDSVYSGILKKSDNFLSEQILYLISSRLGDSLSSERAIQYSLEQHLSEVRAAIKWVDGSGLSRYNQVTPFAMIWVLDHLYQEIPKENLYRLLPEPGKAGSFQNSFLKLQGHLHAKTGSMRHVYNVSGFLETKSGKTLIFSFMNNNFNVSFSELKTEMERVLLVFINDVK